MDSFSVQDYVFRSNILSMKDDGTQFVQLTA